MQRQNVCIGEYPIVRASGIDAPPEKTGAFRRFQVGDAHEDSFVFMF